MSRLIEPFGETVSALRARGHRLRLVAADGSACRRPGRHHRCPAGSRSPRSCRTPRGKWQAFGEADAALIASGTVSLELALVGRAAGLLLQARSVRAHGAEPDHGLDRACCPTSSPTGRSCRKSTTSMCGRNVWRGTSKRCLPTPACAPGRRTALPKSRAAWRRSGRRARSRRRL